MQLLLKKADDELVQRLKDEQYISTYLTDEDDANYFATVTIPCFFGKNRYNSLLIYMDRKNYYNPNKSNIRNNLSISFSSARNHSFHILLYSSG